MVTEVFSVPGRTDVIYVIHRLYQQSKITLWTISMTKFQTRRTMLWWNWGEGGALEYCPESIGQGRTPNPLRFQNLIQHFYKGKLLHSCFTPCP